MKKPSKQQSSRWKALIRFAAGVAGLAVFLGVPLLASASDEVPGPIADAVREALDGWARYATGGDLVALGASFVVGGPQWRQLQAESEKAEGRTTDTPLQFELRELRLRQVDPSTVTVWASVEASQLGFASEVLGWDFDLVYVNGRWRVWTVVPADAPDESAEVAPPPYPTTTSTISTGATVASVTPPQDTTGEGGLAAAATSSPRGARIPVLSAWIVVVTVVGVALAGYMAPRIDRRGGG